MKQIKHKDVPKRAKNSIKYQLEKLIGKYGEMETRLVINKYFENLREQRKAEELIKEKEKELERLRKQKNI